MWPFKPKQHKQVELVRRDVLRITMAEWRSSTELCGMAMRALSDSTVRAMLDVLRTENLANYSMPSNVTSEERIIRQAQCEGYALAINNLEALAKHKAPEQELESTFSPVEMSDMPDGFKMPPAVPDLPPLTKME